jgi:hypothetical protein
MRWLAVVFTVTAALVALVATSGADHRGLVEIGAAVQSFSSDADGASRTEQVSYGETDLQIVASYVVEAGVLQPIPGQTVPAAHRALWQTVEHVLPTAELAEIRQLNVVTDGPNGTLGMVHRSGQATDRWILSLDLAEPERVLEETLIHELAHVLTLDRDDLRTGTDGCDGVRLPLGCARAGSALAQWADQFWPDPDHAATFDREHFVSEYAASAVHEDLAETFLAYVTQRSHASSPVLAEKFAFFDRHPDLAQAAADVRARLGEG